MTDLDAKALMVAAHAFLDAEKAGEERLETAIRAYLAAIGYDAQRAVVEAAREWVAAKTPGRAIAGYRRLSAAVVALEGRTDG